MIQSCLEEWSHEQCHPLPDEDQLIGEDQHLRPLHKGAPLAVPDGPGDLRVRPMLTAQQEAGTFTIYKNISIYLG